MTKSFRRKNSLDDGADVNPKIILDNNLICALLKRAMYLPLLGDISIVTNLWFLFHKSFIQHRAKSEFDSLQAKTFFKEGDYHVNCVDI